MLDKITPTISFNEQNSKAIDMDIIKIEALKKLDVSQCPIDIQERITKAFLDEYRERRIGRPNAFQLALGYHKEFTDPVFETITCDYEFGNRKSIFKAEVKELADFWSSLASGHLGNQLVNHIDSGQPGAIFIFGTYPESTLAAPKITSKDGKLRFKKFNPSLPDKERIRGFVGRCYGTHIPIIFCSKNPIDSFNLMLSIVKHTTNGAAIHQFLPRPNTKIKQEAALCAFTGISVAWSTIIIKKYGSLLNACSTFNIIPQELADIRSDKQRFGERRALKVLREIGLDTKRLAMLANDWGVQL